MTLFSRQLSDLMLACFLGIKSTITRIGMHDATPAELRLQECPFTEYQPRTDGHDFRSALEPGRARIVRAFVESSLAAVPAETRCNVSVTATSPPTAPLRRWSNASCAPSPKLNSSHIILHWVARPV